MSQPIRDQGGHLVFTIGPKNTYLLEDVEILLPVKFRWIPFNRFRGEVENVSANQRPGRPSCFSYLPKNINLVENIEILLPDKFRWIPFSSFREVENVSANQRLGRPSCFSDRPEKHKLGRGRWDLASWQVLLNSVQQFQKRSRKCLSQSEARAAILFFWSAQKYKLGRGHWDLASWQVSLNSVQRFQRSRNVSANQRPGRPSCFSDRPKNTNLVEDVEILLSIKFRWILFSSFREVENVSANQRPGRPSCFYDRPEKHKLARGRSDLASCQVSLNSI